MKISRPTPASEAERPETAAEVGKLGLGALNFAFGTDAYLAEKVAEYRRAVASAEPVGESVTDHFACTPATLVLADDRKACRYGLRGARFFIESLHRYYVGGDRPTGELDVPRDFFSEAEIDEAMVERNAAGSQVSNIVGDPVCARETVSRLAAAGVDELILVMQLGTVPHELVMESIRTFGEEVLPHFS